MLEAVLCRGDRRLGALIEWVWKAGARFDAWDEDFDAGLWERGFEAVGLESSFYANRQRDYAEILPWDHIEAGPDKDKLIEEAKKIRGA